MSFRTSSNVLLSLMVCLLGLVGCSSEQETTPKNTAEPEVQKPAPVNVALTRNSLKPLFEDVFEENQENLKQITKLTFRKIDQSNPSESCNKDLDLLFMERTLDQQESSTCRDKDFEPIDFPVTKLKTSGDTVFLFANKKSLARDDLRRYMESIFRTMAKPNKTLSRYQTADTGLIHRNKGLLMIHGG